MKCNVVQSLRVLALLLTACGGGSGGGDGQPARQDFAAVGQKIFFDTSLSEPRGLSCASCHSPQAAFSDPSHSVVSNGAVTGRTGTRNSPSIMYALFSPVFGFSSDEGDYVGGQFWDGRAPDMEAQARHPLFGAVEMNLSGPRDLQQRIAAAPYAQELRDLYGDNALDDPEHATIAVTNALAAFENSQALRPFSSRYDKWAEGRGTLTPQELRGLALFNAPNKGNCAACHPSTNGDGSPAQALFTDFTYDNVGLGKNPSATSAPDIGLMTATGRPADVGRFKVPTLRNVAVTAPYFHNGSAGTLKEAVHFYNARDVDPTIDPPEFPATMNVLELGNLGLTSAEEDDIVAFLRTLTDEQ